MGILLFDRNLVRIPLLSSLMIRSQFLAKLLINSLRSEVHKHFFLKSDQLLVSPHYLIYFLAAI